MTRVLGCPSQTLRTRKETHGRGLRGKSQTLHLLFFNSNTSPMYDFVKDANSSPIPDLPMNQNSGTGPSNLVQQAHPVIPTGAFSGLRTTARLHRAVVRIKQDSIAGSDKIRIE